MGDLLHRVPFDSTVVTVLALVGRPSTYRHYRVTPVNWNRISLAGNMHLCSVIGPGHSSVTPDSQRTNHNDVEATFP